MSERAADETPVFGRIDEMVSYWRARAPDSLAAVDHDGRRLSWADLDRLVDEARAELILAGVGPGHRVALVIENSVAAIAFLMACSRIGAWAVPLNARLTTEEIEAIVSHCVPQLVVFLSAASANAQAHALRFTAREATVWTWDAVAFAPAVATPPEPVAGEDADRIVVLIYTSGTTGTPKGVMLTQRSVLFVARTSGDLREMSARDLSYLVLPLSHIFGLSSTLLGTFHAGGAVWLANRFDAGKVVDALASGVTDFQGVPAMYAHILSTLGAVATVRAPALRSISSGGSPLDLGWKARIEAAFGLPLGNGYGLTETSPTVAQTRLGERRQDDSIGYPLPGIEVRIAGPDGDLGADAVGELWVRGPGVCAGYYRDPAGTAAAITADGWLKTGDLARQDGDGALFIVGRAKELIIRSGFNVYPADVESALNAHKDVVQSAVVGRTVEGNEEVVAFVQPRAGATLSAADLAAFVEQLLAPYKRPQEIILLDVLPASSTGKVLRKQLAAMAQKPSPGGEAA
ncbi:class I adenylate-forming enzyme family protein [uncultured Sphingomonas sp.]|uniref:class I adenylate-forming enzyme family protein n=1 Tax=uncultured Sphingomonas sp. TaxID=158754 RepID=UPI0035CBC6CB